MNVQYIQDSNGQTTGVFIPIRQWDALKEKFKGIEDEIEIPEWQKQLVRERIEIYKTNNERQSLDEAIDSIEKNLDP